MYQLPPLPVKKKPRPPYRKPDAVRELERMADAEVQKRYENVEAKYLCPRRFRDDDANSLTACIVKYITLKGGFASRINSTGVYDKRLGKYRTGTQKKGIADVWATYKGLSLQIEIKAGKDRQSDVQRKVEADQTAAGGKYYLARNFTDFKTWFDNLV